MSWKIEDDEQLDQRIIDLPAITATIEEGNVPAPLVVTGIHSRAWRRTIAGVGHVFGIRLRPAGLAVVSDLAPTNVAESTLPLTPELDPRLHALMSRIAVEATPAGRAHAADNAIHQLITERAPTPAGLLANDMLDELRESIRHRTGPMFAARFGRSERAIQRALAETLGHGPKWVSRRTRLQEVALTLLARPTDGLATIATDLGYSDQSHLTSDFRHVSGITPDTYRRNAKHVQGEPVPSANAPVHPSHD